MDLEKFPWQIFASTGVRFGVAGSSSCTLMPISVRAAERFWRSCKKEIAAYAGGQESGPP